MKVQDGTDAQQNPVEGVPLHTKTSVLGTVASGGHSFAWRREEWIWPTTPDDLENAVSFPLDVDVVRVGVERNGLMNDGAFEVDLYHVSSLTADEARIAGHALIAAADLADQFNADETEEGA